MAIVKLHKIEQGVCPYCGSKNVSYGVGDLNPDGILYPCACKDCHRFFDEWYELTFVGDNVGADMDTWVNDGDCGVEVEMEDDN